MYIWSTEHLRRQWKWQHYQKCLSKAFVLCTQSPPAFWRLSMFQLELHNNFESLHRQIIPRTWRWESPAPRRFVEYRLATVWFHFQFFPIKIKWNSGKGNELKQFFMLWDWVLVPSNQRSSVGLLLCETNVLISTTNKNIVFQHTYLVFADHGTGVSDLGYSCRHGVSRVISSRMVTTRL